MKNKISYEEVRSITKDIPLHFDYNSCFGGNWYKAIIYDDNTKYIINCSISESTIESLDLNTELHDLLFSNMLTFEYINFDFFNFSLYKEDCNHEILFIKDDD